MLSIWECILLVTWIVVVGEMMWRLLNTLPDKASHNRLHVTPCGVGNRYWMRPSK